jgi:NitT/TauT family transport system substrate-binding protein
VLAAGAALLAPHLARAQAPGTVKLGKQFGAVYLPIDMMVHHRLIEKHALRLGLPEPNVQLASFGGVQAINEAIISGAVDLATGSVAGLSTIWDRTRTGLQVRAIGTLAQVPLTLYTINPAVQSLGDFTDRDRIGMPAVRVSIQATVLEMACERRFGDPERLNPLCVTMANPDAYIAMSSGFGRSAITAHFTVPPYTQLGLRLPGARMLLQSHQEFGGPYTLMTLYNTRRWRDANPVLFQATAAALEEAIALVNDDKRSAAEVWLQMNQSRQSADEISAILADPDVAFSPVPLRTMLFAAFLHRRGQIRQLPASWRDLFWENVHDKDGS